MKNIKKFGSLMIGTIYLYDFIITFSSGNVEQYDVIGLEVSKITYLAFLLAISVSFLTYGLSKQIEERNSANRPASNNN